MPPLTEKDGEARGRFVPREQRQVTILLVARLVTDTGDELCRIRNISTRGMMLETGAALDTGQRVRVELRNLQAVEGRIVWIKSDRTGLQFDAPVGIDLLRARVGRRGAPRPRAPRVSTECPVLVRIEGRVSRAILLDLSSSGGKLALAQRLAPGDQLTVTLPGLAPKRAAVRWTRDGQAGMAFLEAIAFADLDGWLQVPWIRYAARKAGTADDVSA